jgi:haloalkane dehalogenase
MASKMVHLPSGIRTRVIDEGSGPAVLLLHGNPDNADEWRRVIELLSPSNRCVAPDLPGYGTLGEAQPLPRGWAYTVEAQVQFVDQLLAALGIGELALVVHDIGGIMGVPWAARNTARLRSVVYTNTVAYPGFQWFPLAYVFGSRTLVGEVRARLMMAALGLAAGRLFSWQFGARNPQLDAAERARFTRDFGTNAIAKETTRRRLQELVKTGYFDGYDMMLKKIAAAVPTRAVWGQGDPYVSDARADQLFAAQLVRLEGVGHWVPIVAAQTLVGHIRAIDSPVATNTLGA